jgi:hypothetical protein
LAPVETPRKGVVITQAIHQTRIRFRRDRSKFLAIGFGLGFGLSLGLGMVPGAGTEARASRMLAASTNAPLKYPTYLNGEGHVLSESSSTHSLAARDKVKAAYVAFKLENGAAVSKSVPLMKARAPVGSDARQAIAAVTSGVGKIAVKTQKGLFLVGNYRSKFAVANHKTAVKHNDAHRRASTSHVAVKAQPQHLAAAPKAPANQAGGAKGFLNSLLNVKAAQASLASSPIGKLLKLDPPKPTESAAKDHHGNPKPGSPHVATTTPSPSTSAGLTLIPETSATHHEAPVPEPGTLAFAGLVIGGALLRAGLQRRRTGLHSA